MPQYLELESGGFLELEDGDLLELDVIFVADIPNKFTSRPEGYKWVSETVRPFASIKSTRTWPADEDKSWH